MAASPDRGRDTRPMRAVDWGWCELLFRSESVGVRPVRCTNLHIGGAPGLREHGFRTDLADIALTALLGVRSDPGYTP